MCLCITTYVMYMCKRFNKYCNIFEQVPEVDFLGLDYDVWNVFIRIWNWVWLDVYLIYGNKILAFIFWFTWMIYRHLNIMSSCCFSCPTSCCSMTILYVPCHMMNRKMPSRWSVNVPMFLYFHSTIYRRPSGHFSVWWEKHLCHFSYCYCITGFSGKSSRTLWIFVDIKILDVSSVCNVINISVRNNLRNL